MEEEKLNEMYELTKESNKMLHTMRRNARIGGILKFAFWFVFLVIVPYITWTYVQPYFDDMAKLYQQVHGTTATVQASTTSFFGDVQKFFSQFGGTASK